MSLLKNTYLRYGLIGLCAVIVLALALPFAVPVGAFRDRIETAVGTATGRALHIEGPLRLTLFPQFGFKAEKVTFANMAGGRAAAMASVGDIRLAVHFWPLLQGHVVVDEIVLDKPVIALEVDQTGQANWMIGRHQHGSSGGAVTLPLDTQFSGIKIDDGEISYSNAKSHTSRAFEHVNATVAITRLDLPVTVDGNLMLGGRRVDFDAKVTTIKAMLSNASTLLDLSLTSDLMQAGFNGVLAADGSFTGTLKCDSEHLRAASAWLGEKLPEGGGFGTLSLETNLSSKDKVTALSPLRLVLDHATITGALSVDTSGKVPALHGTLAIDRLDLNPYLATAKHAGGARHVDKGWSLEPINLSLLKEADAELTLSVGTLRLRNLRLGRTTLSLSLDDGLLTARLNPVTLYGGSGQAMLVADTRGAVPQFHNTLQFEHIAQLPFLNDALGIDHIQGTGALTLDIAARGDNAFAVMHTALGQRFHRRRAGPHQRRRSRSGGARDCERSGPRLDRRDHRHRFYGFRRQLHDQQWRARHARFPPRRFAAVDDRHGQRRHSRAHARSQADTKGHDKGRRHRHTFPCHRIVGSRQIRARLCGDRERRDAESRTRPRAVQGPLRRRQAQGSDSRAKSAAAEEKEESGRQAEEHARYSLRENMKRWDRDLRHRGGGRVSRRLRLLSFRNAPRAGVDAGELGRALRPCAGERPASALRRESGADARIADYDGGTSDLARQVAAKSYTWDVIDLELPDAVEACRAGLLERIDPASLPPGSDGVAAARFRSRRAGALLGGQVYVYSQAIAYDLRRLRG